MRQPITRVSLPFIVLCMSLLVSPGCGDSEQQGPERIVAPHRTSPGRDLPKPRLRGERSLEETLAARRSVREFTGESLTDAEFSQLLWAAQGVTNEEGRRTSPSAGALYPLKLYVVTESGFSHYSPSKHQLSQMDDRDLRSAVQAAALGQKSVGDAPAVFVMTGVYARTRAKYGDGAERYVHMEAGHAAQNLLLQAVAMDLGGVTVGAIENEKLSKALGLPDDEDPLYVIPVGHPQ